MGNSEKEKIPEDQPKILIFPDPQLIQNLAETVEELRNRFRVRTAKDTKGRWGHKDIDDGEMLLAKRPDILLIFDPLKDSRAAHLMAKVPKRKDGRPVPAIVVVPTILPQEMPHVRVSHFAGQPFKRIHWPIKLTPGHAGTIMDVVDAVVVRSKEDGEAWNQYYRTEYKVVSPEEDVISNIRQIGIFCNEILEKHRRPKSEEWPVRKLV